MYQMHINYKTRVNQGGFSVFLHMQLMAVEDSGKNDCDSLQLLFSRWEGLTCLSPSLHHQTPAFHKTSDWQTLKRRLNSRKVIVCLCGCSETELRAMQSARPSEVMVSTAVFQEFLHLTFISNAFIRNEFNIMKTRFTLTRR